MGKHRKRMKTDRIIELELQSRIMHNLLFPEVSHLVCRKFLHTISDLIISPALATVQKDWPEVLQRWTDM